MRTALTTHALLWVSICWLACGERDRSLDGRVTGSATLVGMTDHSGIEATLVEAKRSVMSEANGRFTIPDVRFGVYTLTLRKGAFEETIPDVLVLPGHTGLYLGSTLEPLQKVELQRGQRLLKDHRPSYGMQVSQDKARIFFWSPEEDGGMGLYTALAKDRVPKKLTVRPEESITPSGYPSGPAGVDAIAPDGKHVVLRTMVETDEGPQSKMVVISTERGTTTILEDAQSIFGFSPDGRHLVFNVGVDPRAGGDPRQSQQFRIANLAGDELTFRTVTISPSGYGYGVTFAGSRLVLQTGTGLRVIDLDGDAERTIATGPIGRLRLSPDGETVLFASQSRSYPYVATLNIARLATGVVQVLASGLPQGYEPPAEFSPSGDRVAFIEALQAQYPPIGRLKVVHIADGSTTTVMESTRALRFQFSGDGNHILLHDSYGGPGELKVVASAGGSVRSLGIATQYGLSRDAMQVAFVVGTDPTNAVLRAAPIATGEVVGIATDAFPFASPSFSPDGTRIVYYARSADPAQQPSLKAAPATGGDAVTLIAKVTSSGQSGGWQFSPDGTRMLWQNVSTQGPTPTPRAALQVIPLDGSKPTTIVSNVSQAAWLDDQHVISERQPSSQGFDFQRAIYVSEVN